MSGYTEESYIDLSAGKIEITDLNEKLALNYLGGKGLGGHLLFKYKNAAIDPSDS